MASSTSRNSDLSRCTSSSTKQPPISDRKKENLVSMSVDGLLRNVYSDIPSSETTLINAEFTLLDAPVPVDGEANNLPLVSRQESFSNVQKSVDDVWREIVAGDSKECKVEVPDAMMTLEDFLARAGAVEEDEIKMPQSLTDTLSGGLFAIDPIPSSPFPVTPMEGSVTGFSNGVEVIGGKRGKRKADVLEPLDKAAQQRQRRMIKNRESAARSRERKQAYQAELESLAVKLEEENELLLKEKDERTKERLKQLMEKVIPVTEQRRPARVLRRVGSSQW